MKKFLFTITAIFFLIVPLNPAFGSWANPELLYSVEQTEKIVGDSKWVILDCRGQEVYEKGHIPGAIVLDKKSAKIFLRDGTARVFTDVSKYEKMFGGAGIGNDTNILVYSDLNHRLMDDAFLTFWLLEYLGHTKVHLLDGGFDAWTKAKKKIETALSKGTPAVFKVKAKNSILATSEELFALAQGKAKDSQLVDCRTKEEFEGYDIRALRGGHVPNTTKNVSHVTFFEQKKDEKTGRNIPTGILSEATVMKALEGVDKNKRTIFLCHSGTRSTFGYFVSRLMGFANAANHDDGWIVWGSNYQKNYPVESEQWIEMARIDESEKKIKSLEEKFKVLEEKLKAVEEKK
jgi:thiosulfate/3-mercaptopyruvate sulfurtransferase